MNAPTPTEWLRMSAGSGEMPSSPPPTNSPLHQPARDNAGNVLPELHSHQQQPDVRSAPEPGSLSRPPERRGALTNAEFHRLPADQQNRYAQLAADNWVLRSDLEQAAPKPGDQPAPASDGTTIKVGDVELTADQVKQLLVDKANADARKAAMPASPDGYEATLPADFKLPDGIEWKVDPADPLLADAKRWAHTRGLDQQAFSELVGLYTAAQAGSEAQIQTARQAEINKLGANGSMRVTALQTFFTGLVGSENAKAIDGMMATAGIVKALEAVHAKFSSQGAASFSQAHREPGAGAGKVTDEQWVGMSDAAKLNYARSHQGAR
jgi:hypothetical protein